MFETSYSAASPPFNPVPPTAAARAPYPWIVHPVFDFLFVCGGLPLLLIGLNVWAIGWRVPFDSTEAGQKYALMLLLVGQHLFANAHNAATHLRIWGDQEDRARFSFYRTWLLYSCIPLFALGLFYPPATSVFVYLYLITVFWHYAAQSFGISLIYCAKRGYGMTPVERKIFKGFFIALSGYVIVRFMTFRELSPQVWFGVPIPFWGPLPAILHSAVQITFAGYLLAFAGVVIRKLLKEHKRFPLPSAMIVGTMLWLGISLGPANALLWLYVPAFFHGSQYLAV